MSSVDANDKGNDGQTQKQQSHFIRTELYNPIIKIIGFSRRNMAATDGQIILAASRFGDTPPTYLR